MSDLLIKNATIITVNPKNEVISEGGVLIEDNIISAVSGEPLQALTQTLCLIASFFISIFLVNLNGVVFPLEVLYYISYFSLTIIIYLIFILIFRGVRAITRNIFPTENYSSKLVLRKRHRPKKPPKDQEGRW